MKLSVMTYRASCERLNLIRQSSYGSTNQSARRGSSLDSCLLPSSAPARYTGIYRKAFSDRLVSPPPPRRARVVSFDLSDDEEDDYYDEYGFDEEESVESGGGVMMVDGGRSPFPPPPPHPLTTDQTTIKEIDDSAVAVTSSAPSTTECSTAPPSAASGPLVPTEQTSVTTSSRSRWMKLRTTVQLSSAITQVNKKPPLKREDSFLKRFSTRPMIDPNAADGSSRGGDGMARPPFLWRSVVNPDENILFYWLSLLTVCLLYNAWTIIVRQAFPELQTEWSTLWYCLDGFTDVVFVLDVAFQFRTGYLEQGLMVCDSKKLACHYIKSRSFLFDMLAIIPLDLLQLYFGIYPILRFPRFFKLYRSFRLYYMVESRTIYPNLWRVVNLIHILLLLAHWFGCFYYLLSELEDFVGEWSYRKPIDDYALLSRKYLGSVYWSTLTLTTIGDLATPATNLQYMFTIISYLIGVFIFATIVGQVGTVITNRNASRLEFERLLDGAKLYMRHHKVPRNMQRRVQRWYDYSWSRGRMQGGGDINSALGILPDKLKTELALHVNLKTLKKVSIFQECQPEFLHDLVLKMRAYIFTPGDLICRKGEVAREMFIIADGILEVISETGRVLTQMKAGDFFGEIGILNLDGFNRRTADVRSVGYSELFSLSREDILAAMKDYPEAQEILQTMGRKRLMEARLAANIGRAVGGETKPPAAAGAAVADDGRPKSTVSKLKEDVRSLTKLLRTRSTTTGTATDSTETIELKPLNTGEESPTIKLDEPGARKRNVSFKNLIQKIQFKRDDSTSSLKSFTERLASFKVRTEKTYVESSSVSTEDSADSTTPLNKSLPLLQRIRLLGEQEKKSEILAPGSLLKGQKPGLQNSEEIETKKKTSLKSESNKGDSPPPSPKSKAGAFSSMLTSVIPKGSTSPKRQSSFKAETSPEGGKKSPVVLKGRPPDAISEIPLLKKVLLRQVMDDKKTDNALQTENQNPGEDVEEDDKSGEAEVVSNRVYLEQFSRTLGFQMSEDVQQPPRPRLNASSLTPSPSKENVDDEKQPTAQEEEQTQKSPPKGRLSRMMAVREDSDESSILTDDPFVKSMECQTEISGGAFDLKNMPELIKCESEVDTSLRGYLTKMIVELETIIKEYSKAHLVDLTEENRMLKENQAKQEIFIKKLLARIEETQETPWEPFEEVSSLEASSISASDTIKDNHSLLKETSVEEDDNNPTDEEERDLDEEDRDLEDDEVLGLHDRIQHQRKSWPTHITVRRRLEPKSNSLDDEAQDPAIPDPDELWRLEFPPPPPDLDENSWMAAVAKPIFSTVPESLIEEVLPTEEEQEEEGEEEARDEAASANDWEVQMLVEQFDEEHHQQQQQQGRRHSSGEALAWDRVMRSNAPKRSRRKFSLAEEPSHSSLPTHHHHHHNRRKGSLPAMPPADGISIARWLSMERVEGQPQQSSLSSGGSQETVVDVSDFQSIDCRDSTRLGTRSPSSPNVASADIPRLPDWTSSTPCLPVIPESGGRSQGCLPKRRADHPRTQRCTLEVDNQRYANAMTSMSGDPRSLSQNSVAISIPECDPVLSP